MTRRKGTNTKAAESKTGVPVRRTVPLRPGHNGDRTTATHELDQPASGPPAQPRKSILVVDDHPLFRFALQQILNREPDLSVTGTAGDIRTARSLLEQESFHLAIVDLFLDNSYNPELIKDIHQLRPNTRVLAISQIQEQVYVGSALRDGARGFLHKSAGPEELVTAVRQVLNGGTYLADEVKEWLLQNAFQPARNGERVLSDRELEVFEMMGHGCASADIARALGVSSQTVETYRSRIKDKLGMRDMVDLAAHAGQWVAGRVRWFVHPSSTSLRK